MSQTALNLRQLSLDESLDNEFRAVLRKLEKFWATRLKDREVVKADQQRLMWGRALPALTELLLIGREMDGERLFNKLVAFCILMSGLGTPRSEAVVKETYPALQSVVKKTDVTKLTDLGRNEREQHLLELVQIVMGIRLFNKDCCKGGEGIDDLPELLTRAVKAAKIQHQTSTNLIQKRIINLTSTLKNLCGIDGSRETIQGAKLDTERLKSALCLFWAQFFYLKDLFVELTTSEENISVCVEQLRETLVQLHETVRYRAAIPTIQVYPLFVQLSLVWRELQYEAAVLSHFSQILTPVASIADDLDVSYEGMTGTPPETDFITPDEHFPFNGFCPATLVQTGGVLIAGTFKQENILFRSSEAAKFWSRDISSSCNQLQTVLRALPELRHFIKIVPNISSEPEKAPEEPVTTAEIGVQTETHPIKAYIDRNYAWSEWELKQRSVKLARIFEKSTKSQQTLVSYYRVDKKV